MKKRREVKGSLILSLELYSKVQAACGVQGMTFCGLMRKILADHLDQYLETPGGCGALLRWAGAAPGDPLGEALAAAARWWRLAPADLARLIVAENVAGYAERGRRQWEAMAATANLPEPAAVEPD